MADHKNTIQKSVISYYFDGYKLLNKYFYLYLFSAALYVLSILRNNIKLLFNNQINFLINLSFILLFVIQYSFSISFPLLIQIKQNKQKLDINKIITILITNFKRSIIPIIVLGFILGLFILVLSLIIILLFGITSFTSQNIIKMTPFLMLLSLFICYPFLVFSSIFFSVNKKGYYKSFILSFKLAIKHPKYVLLGLLISSIMYSAAVLLNNQSPLGIILTIINTYIYHGITTSSLLYFQDHYREENPQ